jgi:hypothetical protein
VARVVAVIEVVRRAERAGDGVEGGGGGQLPGGLVQACVDCSACRRSPSGAAPRPHR